MWRRQWAANMADIDADTPCIGRGFVCMTVAALFDRAFCRKSPFCPLSFEWPPYSDYLEQAPEY